MNTVYSSFQAAQNLQDLLMFYSATHSFICMVIKFHFLADHQDSFPEQEASYVWSLKEALATRLIMDPLRSEGAFEQTELTLNTQAPLT